MAGVRIVGIGIYTGSDNHVFVRRLVSAVRILSVEVQCGVTDDCTVFYFYANVVMFPR